MKNLIKWLKLNKIRMLLYSIIPLAFLFYLIQAFIINDTAYSVQIHFNLTSNSFIELIGSFAMLFMGIKLQLDVPLQIYILFFILLKILAFLGNFFLISKLLFFHSFWMILIFVFIIHFLVKRQNWLLNNNRSIIDKKSYGVYIKAKKPKSILQIFQSFFGYGIGSMDILVSSEEKYVLYHFNKKDSTLHQIDDYHEKFLLDDYFIKIYDNPIHFTEIIEKHSIVGAKYHLFKKSCLTVWKPVFKEIGIEVKTFLLSVFIKEIKEKKDNKNGKERIINI